MGIDWILLSNAIWILYINIWIRYALYNMEGFDKLMYICIYEYTTKRNTAVIYLNNIDYYAIRKRT